MKSDRITGDLVLLVQQITSCLHISMALTVDDDVDSRVDHLLGLLLSAALSEQTCKTLIYWPLCQAIGLV